LRYLQTLAGIAGDKTNTIVFPVPGDFLNLLMRDKTLGG
ncbi:MAG: slipin family protein, partial [Gammaproteobacteria bacterium]